MAQLDALQSITVECCEKDKRIAKPLWKPRCMPTGMHQKHLHQPGDRWNLCPNRAWISWVGWTTHQVFQSLFYRNLVKGHQHIRKFYWCRRSLWETSQMLELKLHVLQVHANALRLRREQLVVQTFLLRVVALHWIWKGFWTKQSFRSKSLKLCQGEVILQNILSSKVVEFFNLSHCNDLFLHPKTWQESLCWSWEQVQSCSCHRCWLRHLLGERIRSRTYCGCKRDVWLQHRRVWTEAGHRRFKLNMTVLCIDKFKLCFFIFM